jgi:zinc protease
MFLSLLTAAGLTMGVANAADYPKAKYDLKLDQYAISTQDYQFPSGLRILFQEDHTQPIVSITNWFDRGSVYDGVSVNGESTEGIAHAVEHLAFRARHGDLPKNWDVINQLGGILNASTSREWTNYMTVAPVDAAIPLMRIEALRMEDGIAGVTEEDVEAEKSIVRNELRMGYESGANGSAAVRTAFVHLPKLLFPPGHIYQNSTIGSHETIMNITLADVQRYVDENYRPEFSTIAVVGDFTLDGGMGMGMVFDAFEGIEHLLMADDDAEAYEKLEDPNDRIDFLNEWVPQLAEYIRTEGAEPPKPRVDCSEKVEPPALHDDQLLKIQGMVDKTTAIAAWSLPSGYCADDVNMNIAANLLSNYIQRAADPKYNPLSGEQENNSVGCFVDADRRGSILVCFVEGGLGGLNAERSLDRVADALYMQTQAVDVIFKPFLDQSLTQSRLYNMSSLLGMTDNVASLYGRSFFVSQHAHYTGSAQFFSDSIRDTNVMSFEAAKEIAAKYITRDRMARLIIEPMDEEARERLEASSSDADKSNDVAGDHRAKDDRSRQLFNTDDLTPDAIAAVTVVPDMAKARNFSLDNGLEVTIMNHGEAPLVKVGIVVEGSDDVAPKLGMDPLSSYLRWNGRTTDRNMMEMPLAIAGEASARSNSIYASGSSGNLDALLHKVRSYLADVEWDMADKSQVIRRWTNNAKSGGKKPENWASRIGPNRLFGGDHPYGQWYTPEIYQAFKDLSGQEVKDWYNTKWQPQNARLVVVGKVTDMELAEQQVREFFSTWAYEGPGDAATIEPPAPPTKLADRQVLLFDKPIATQSKLQVSCRLDYSGREDLARTQVLGEYFTFLSFERLREEAGLTYGAYAYPRAYWGNTRELVLASVIQNSGIGFGVKTFFEIIEEGASGDVDEGDVRTNAWNVGRTSVTGLQSGSQMRSALLSPGRGKLGEYAKYPAQLGGVTAADIAEALVPCKGHEVVTIVGPVAQATPQLDELGIAYEVVDWEGMYEAQLNKKELKSYRKAKAKEAEAEAKKAAEGEADSDET